MQFGDNPVTRNGRVIPDPQAIMQAGNLYVYCINNPIMFTDPSGRIIKAIIAALAKKAAPAAGTTTAVKRTASSSNRAAPSAQQQAANRTAPATTQTVNRATPATNQTGNRAVPSANQAVRVDPAANQTGNRATPATRTTPTRGVEGKGWRGDQTWRNDVSTVRNGGTINDLNGRIPTRSEAIDLIKESGGRVTRIEGPHNAPNPHNFHHINYTTQSGARGTIRIKP